MTIDFTIEDFRNKSTGEKVASFTVPDNVTCVKVEGKHIYPLDPGEVVVSVKWNGLQRKVHLDITYGKEWTGGRNEVFDNGDGTEEHPYLIYNADQLNSATGMNKYNKETVYLKLASDIFFNTHLLQTDGTPRDGAVKWTPRDFKAHLDGNGKTIYGLYVNKTNCENETSYGLFANLYGSVGNLAIVDSDVSATGGSGVSAGLICGKMMNGSSISNCMVHGNVASQGYTGGICGSAEETGTTMTDCFSNVHIGWPGGIGDYFGAGMVYITPATMERCFSIGKVENRSDQACYGLTQTSRNANNSYFDHQMMSVDYSSQGGAKSTNEILQGQLFKGKDLWQQDDERYPMLKTFAGTPYGQRLSA